MCNDAHITQKIENKQTDYLLVPKECPSASVAANEKSVSHPSLRSHAAADSGQSCEADLSPIPKAISKLQRTCWSKDIRINTNVAWNGIQQSCYPIAAHCLHCHGPIQRKITRRRKIIAHTSGIGRYTANAVACFAFGQIVPVVDTNVKRVLSRLFPQFPNTDHHWSLAESLLPRRNAFEWNQGLMELGATLCTTLSPHCNQCPVRRLCPSSSPPLLKRIASRKNKPRKVDIPNRIYRGRIIETLRNLRDGQSIEAAKVGKKIKNDYSHRDQKWLMELILKLQRDGLLLVHRNGSRAFISLPA